MIESSQGINNIAKSNVETIDFYGKCCELVLVFLKAVLFGLSH